VVNVPFPFLVQITVQMVNRYYGKGVFSEDDDGFFQKIGNRYYVFEYTSHRDSCSNVKSVLHDKLVRLIHQESGNKSLFHNNMFEKKDSPGRAFYRIPEDVDIIENEESKEISMVSDSRNNIKLVDDILLPREICLQQLLVGQLYKIGIDLLYLDAIQSTFAPFSGGGDIVMFCDTSSTVITTGTGLKPNSPTEDDEAKFCFDFELCKDSVRQLLADMLVASALLIERMCKNNDERLHHLKKLSVYGLAMDLVLPFQLYKLTMDFENKSLLIINKGNFESHCYPSLIADKLITYMIRNTCSTC